MMRFYLDTAIWRDYFENRSDNFRPLGEWACDFIKRAAVHKATFLFSRIVIQELRKVYSQDQIENIFSIVEEGSLREVKVVKVQID